MKKAAMQSILLNMTMTNWVICQSECYFCLFKTLVSVVFWEGGVCKSKTPTTSHYDSDDQQRIPNWVNKILFLFIKYQCCLYFPQVHVQQKVSGQHTFLPRQSVTGFHHLLRCAQRQWSGRPSTASSHHQQAEVQQQHGHSRCFCSQPK